MTPSATPSKPTPDADEAALGELMQRLRAEAVRGGRSLWVSLADAPQTGQWTTEDRLALVGQWFHYPTVRAPEMLQWIEEWGAPAFDVYSLSEVATRQCLLWRRAGAGWVGVVADPMAVRVQQEAEIAAGAPITWYLSDPESITRLVQQFDRESTTLPLIDLASDETPPASDDSGDITLISLGAEQGPAVNLINATLYDALKSGASDIHLESDAQGLVVKYRLDGVLVVAGGTKGETAARQALSRLKVMSGLDIAERRVPQDGRFKARVRGREVDFRVSVMPSVYGEDAVIRILDREQLTGSLRGLTLDALGFDAEVLAAVRRIVAEPYGLFLVTGPTGSGKTTTLYAALSEINSGREKIVTIEDPVEYLLPGILQIPVNERKGLSFARGLRSILRHDPDKIMIGEIRDADTAEIAVQSALTGHLVLTTVHANSVFDVVGRFIHMGIDPHGLVSALAGVVAQRLLRLNCSHCVKTVLVDFAHPLFAESGPPPHWRYQEGAGCEHCRGTGYRGRIAIAEILEIDDAFRDLIIARASSQTLKAAARRLGTRSLRTVALDLAASGRTTLGEIQRVISFRD